MKSWIQWSPRSVEYMGGNCDCLLPCLGETSWSTQQGDSKKVTLYLTAGIIIFDTLVPRAFQKYTTCMVFKAVQLFKKSATWFSENEGGGVKGRLELFQKFIRFGRGRLPLLVPFHPYIVTLSLSSVMIVIISRGLHPPTLLVPFHRFICHCHKCDH